MDGIRVAIVCLFALPVFPATSVRVTSGAIATQGFPGAPFNKFGSYSFRIEGRLHNWGAGDFQPVGVGQIFLRSNTKDPRESIGTTIHFTGDAIANGPMGIKGCCKPGDDITYRIQRDLAKVNCPQFAVGCYTIEFWNIVTGEYNSAISEILKTNPDWTKLGAPSAQISPGVDVAWLEWYTGAIKIGHGATYCEKSPAGPCQPDLSDSQKGDLASYKFERNLNDSSKAKADLAGGAVTYVPTPAYGPSCNAGAQQVFQVGAPATLAGYGLSRDGATSAITVSWQQVAGPPVTLSGQNTATPTVTGLQATNNPSGPSSYMFQLTATDGSGRSASCTVKDGAVATDANGIVLTNNPIVDQLVHPQLRLGAASQPWPWFDDRAMAAANLELDHVYGLRGCTSQDFNVCAFQTWWKKYGEGTVSLKDGSTDLTGAGTNLLKAFNCAPGGAPPAFGVIAIEYSAGIPATNHYRMFNLATCIDATHAKLDQPWHSVLGAPTGHYAFDISGAAYQWSLNSNAQFPANFYDNALAFYVMYLRTGLDDFLTAFRRAADEWWEQPTMDQGVCFGYDKGTIPGTSWCQGFAWRSHSMLGVVLRALDKGDTPPYGMWAGMRDLWDFSVYHLGVNHYWTQKVGEREAGVILEEVALCAQFDPAFFAPSRGMSCREALDYALTTDSPYWSEPTYGGLYSLTGATYFSGTTAQASGGQFTTTVSLTNGSKSVTCVDGPQGKCGWKPEKFDPIHAQLWVLHAGYKPFTQAGYPEFSSAGEPVSYGIASIDDSNHLTLSRPYQGPTSTGKQYGLYITGNPNSVGFFIQPYMEGIAGDALDRVARALTTVGDGSNAATARKFSTSASTWIRDYAMDTTLVGTWYFRGSPNCPIENTPRDGNCNNATDAATARILNAETALAMQDEYLALGTPEARAATDTFLNAMWAKPGTCAGHADCKPDGSYVNCLEDGGYCLSFAPGAAPWKWFGQFFGASMAPSWAAARLAKVRPPGTDPSIGALSPGAVYSGGGEFTLSVTGTSFGSSAVVQWNGKPLPTTFVSSTRLTASVSAGLIASAGTASITVSSSGKTSQAATVQIAPVVAGLKFGNQRVSAQPPGAGCSLAPSITPQAGGAANFLSFETSLPSGAPVTADWLTPDGTSAYPAQFKPGASCYSTALPSGAVPAALRGNWQGRVFVNGILLFSVPVKL